MICTYCEREIVDDAVYCPHCATPVEGAVECDDFEYEAFISYRHLPRDREVAVKIQKAIEGFTIPSHLRTLGGPKKLGRLFRDEDELPTSSSLPDQIREALKRSRFLIVICSTKTNESQWVAREVELFSSYHGRDNVRIALAEAEPEDSFPTLLRTKLVRGTDGNIVEIAEEPLAADFRDLSRKHFNTEKYRLIAPIVGCGYDDLRQRLKTRSMRVATAITSAIAAVSVGFGAFSYYQQVQIEANYRQMQINESEFLATESGDLLAQGDRMQAIQVALAALPTSESDVNGRPYVPAAQLALENALDVYPSNAYWRSCYSLPDGIGSHVVASPEGYVAMVGEDRLVRIADLATGTTVVEIDAESAMGLSEIADKPFDRLLFAGKRLICIRDDLLGCFDVQTGAFLWASTVEDLDFLSAIAVSEDDSKIAIVSLHWDLFAEDDSNRYSLRVFDVETGRKLYDEYLPPEGNIEGHSYEKASELCFLDGNTVAVASCGALFTVDISNGSINTASTKYECPQIVRCLDGQLYVVSQARSNGIDEPVVIESFDGSLAKLWEYESNPYKTGSVNYSNSGMPYAVVVDVVGIWKSTKYEHPQVVAVLSNVITLLDTSDGSVSYETRTTSPIAACSVVERLGQRNVVAVTGAGEALWRNPNATDVTGAVYDSTISEFASAEFVAQGDEIYVVGKDLIGTGQHVYRFTERTDAVGEVIMLQGSLNDSMFMWNGQGAVAEISDTAVSVYDGETFERRFSIGLKSLPGFASDSYVNASMTADGKLIVYGTKSGVEQDYSRDIIMVDVVSIEDGSLCASFEISEEGLYYSGVEIRQVENADGTTSLALFNQSEMRFIDLETGEVTQHLVLDSWYSGAWTTPTHIVVCESPNNPDKELVTSIDRAPYHFALIDRASGQRVACDLDNFGPYGQSGDPVACMSSDISRFAAVCAGGEIVMFDSKTGSKIWETGEAVREATNLYIDSATGNVLVQDAMGRCTLLSGKDGTILRASSTALPAIEAFNELEGEHVVAARWRIPGYDNSLGIAFISLDEDAFGPMCNISGAFFVGKDGSSVLVSDVMRGGVRIVHRYSLDELIAYAHEVIVGHELSEAERHLYLID